MRIAFDRFVALTTALAGAGASLSACGTDTVDTEPGTGGSMSAGASGKGGRAGNGAGGTRASGGSAGKSSSSGGSSGASGGNTSSSGGSAGTTGGSAGTSGGSGGSANAGSGNAGTPASGGTNDGTGGTGLAGTAGEGGSANEGGEGGAAGSIEAGAGGEPAAAGSANAGGTGGTPGGAGEGGVPASGEAGHGGDTGEGGAPSEVCLGDTGIADCSGLGLPTDECSYEPNPLLISCYASTGDLRPGALEGLGACLLAITDDSCSSEAAEETYACETDVARRACPAPEALDACANGVTLEGGGTIDSPLVACDDGSLTEEHCTELLNAVKLDALPLVVACADPAGEYGSVFSGTCAERLHHCVFPHSWFYPW